LYYRFSAVSKIHKKGAGFIGGYCLNKSLQNLQKNGNLYFSMSLLYYWDIPEKRERFFERLIRISENRRRREYEHSRIDGRIGDLLRRYAADRLDRPKKGRR
jgi:hypothetical protein